MSVKSMGAISDIITSWAGSVQSGLMLLPMSEESGQMEIQPIVAEYLRGNASAIIEGNGVKMVTLPMSGDLTYLYSNFGIQNILKSLFGDIATSGDYTYHALENEPGNYVTVLIQKASTPVWTFNPCLFKQLTISGNANDSKILWSAEAVAKALDAASAESISGLLSNRQDGIISFQDLTIALAADSADPFSTGDLEISEFELSCGIPYSDEDHVSNQSDEIIEPKINGYREITLNLTFPRQTYATLLTYFNSKSTVGKLRLSFVSGSKEFHVLLPNVKVTELDEPIGGAEVIQTTAVLTATAASSTYAMDRSLISGNVTNEMEIIYK